MNVEREIPLDILSKIGSEYTLSGGTIRVAKGYDGAGQIVRHLVYPSDAKSAENILSDIKTKVIQTQDVISTVKNGNTILKSIQSLQHMTIALQGMNLAVSAVGFVLVINKLNKISQKIDDLHQKIDFVLEDINDLKYYQECIQATKFSATLKNLESSLRIRNKSESYSLINRLRESQELFMYQCDMYVNPNDVKRFFYQTELFDQYYQGVLGSSFAIANAFFQLGETQEALNVIQSIKSWQLIIESSLKKVILGSNPPVWLGKLTDKQKNYSKKSLLLIHDTASALEYTKNTYQICIDESLDLNQLMHNEKELLVIAPKKRNTTTI